MKTPILRRLSALETQAGRKNGPASAARIARERREAVGQAAVAFAEGKASADELGKTLSNIAPNPTPYPPGVVADARRVLCEQLALPFDDAACG